MNTLHETTILDTTRTTFIETLSDQFIALTGCGVYVYLNPVDIDELFHLYLNDSISIRSFARQCVKNVLE